MRLGPGLGRFCAGIALALVAVACVALAPAGTLAQLPLNAAFLPPGGAHPFGTDDLGRDLLAAMAQAGRTSLLVAGSATTISLVIGTLLGLMAGSSRTAIDEALMRFADIVAGFPTIMLALVLVSLSGGSSTAVALVIGLTRWPMIARLVRAETLALRRSEFVTAAVALGASPTAIARRHLLPHVLTVVSSAAGIVFGGALIAEAAVAFVGLGDPMTTSWGQLLANGFAFVDRAWWVWVFPAAGLALTSGLVAAACTREQRT
jgi:peptide/nickel transport system permease protein